MLMVRLSKFEKCGDFRIATLDVSFISDNLYEINRIKVPHEYRGRGIARKLMKSLMDDADRHGMTLQLWINCYNDGGLSHDQLAAWYERLGFVNDGNGTYTRKPK